MNAAVQIARRPEVRLLPDGRRMYLTDGPIDLVIEAYGPRDAVLAAYRAAFARATGLLDELCDELPLLRRHVCRRAVRPAGEVARKMFDAVRPFAAGSFITPMAAVAGSVADAVLGAMTAASGDALSRAYVNNGGDIALHLAPGTSFTAGLVDRPDRPNLFARTVIRAEDGVRGIATSGARGRSFSLGIADAVTVLARDAAQADAAATVVANAVDVAHPDIVRLPARALAPDSDLGDRLVTRSVPLLAAADLDAALTAGTRIAERLIDDGAITAAALHLQGETRTAGRIAAPLLLRQRHTP